MTEKMNVFIVTKDKVTRTEKEGRWFTQLFLPLFKSNKDPLGKQPKLDDYWNEIRACLLGKKTNKNLKIIKHKDIKFIGFSVSNGQVLAFAVGTEKSGALNDIYKLTQEKAEGMNYNKYLKLIGAEDTEAVKQTYENIAQEISDKDIKDWGYNSAEDMIKSNAKSGQLDFESPYMSGRKIGSSISLSKYSLKDWGQEIIKTVGTKVDYLVSDFKQRNDVEKIENKQEFGKWIIDNECKCGVFDMNGHKSECTFQEFIDYYANKDVYNNLSKLYEAIGIFYLKNKPENKVRNDEQLSKMHELFNYLDKQIKDDKIKLSMSADQLISVVSGNAMIYVTFNTKKKLFVIQHGKDSMFVGSKGSVLSEIYNILDKYGSKSDKDQEKLQKLYNYLKENCQDDFEWEKGSEDVELKGNKLTINYGNASYTITCKDQEYKVTDNVTKMNGCYETIPEVLDILGIAESEKENQYSPESSRDIIQNESRLKDKLDKRIKHSDITDWISEHDQAWADYCEHFAVKDDTPTHVTPDDTIGWISDHDMLYDDFCNHFNLDPDFVENHSAEDYVTDDLTHS